MGLDTRPNLDDSKFEQFSGDELNLSGTNKIHGTLEIKTGAALNIESGATTGYVLTSDASGNASWEEPAGITAATNGLNETSGIVKLGGAIDENTTLSVGGGNSFSICSGLFLNLHNFTLFSLTGTSGNVLACGTLGLGVNSGGTCSQFNITNSCSEFIDDFNSEGLVYESDYSAVGGTNPRWIPDAAWVTGQTSGLYTFTNGLNETSGTVKLGGSISENTTLSVGGGDNFSICSGLFFNVHNFTLFSITGTSGNVLACGTLGLGVSSGGTCSQFDMSCACNKFIDEFGLEGLVYESDYSLVGSQNPRWIPDAAWVTGETSGLLSDADNGLTVNGTIVELGGTLCKNTTIDTDTYALHLCSSSNLNRICLGTTSVDLRTGDIVSDYGNVRITNNNVSIKSQSGTSVAAITLQHATNEICFNSAAGVRSCHTSSGFYYTADFSGTGGSNPRWIPDAAWVTGQTPTVSASGENIKKEVSQASHGFAVKDFIGWSGGTYNKAIADGTYDGEFVGLVTEVPDSNTFCVTQAGYITGLTSLVTNTTYFLSESTAGQITATEPTGDGEVSKAVLIADSTTTGWVLPYPGWVVSTGTTSLSSAGNGLTANGSTVELGGILTKQTCISGPFDLRLTGITLTQICASTTAIQSSGTAFFGVGNTNSGQYLCVTTSCMSVYDDINSEGLVYESDYSAVGGTNPRWIPDAAWVTGNTGGGTITGGENGLSTDGANVVLGGTLSADTTIDTSTFDLGFLGIPAKTSETNVLFIDSDGTLATGQTAAGFDMSGSTVDGITTYVDSNTICAQESLKFDGTSLLLTGNTVLAKGAHRFICMPTHDASELAFDIIIDGGGRNAVGLNSNLGDVYVRGGCGNVSNCDIGGGCLFLQGGGANSNTGATGGNVCVLGGAANNTVSGDAVGGNVFIKGGTASGGNTNTCGCVSIFHGNEKRLETSAYGLKLLNITGKTTQSNILYVGSDGIVASGASAGGGGINMSGSTVNGLTTYVDSDTICAQPNLTFDGSVLNVNGCAIADYMRVNNSSTSSSRLVVSASTTGGETAGFFIGSSDDTSGTNYGVIINNKGTAGAQYYGLLVNAFSDTAEAEGRSYGIRGIAGNRTEGFNIGVIGQICGTNCGIGVLADDGTYGFAASPSGTWALLVNGNSYFCGNQCLIGNLHFCQGGDRTICIDTATDGGPGDSLRLNAGCGDSDTTPGSGGNFIVCAGCGGNDTASSSGVGADGGCVLIYGGSGGAAPSGIAEGGNGGRVIIRSGPGGSAYSGGDGGDIEICAGDGHNGNVDGTGGSIYLCAGCGYSALHGQIHMMSDNPNVLRIRQLTDCDPYLSFHCDDVSETRIAYIRGCGSNGTFGLVLCNDSGTGIKLASTAACTVGVHCSDTCFTSPVLCGTSCVRAAVNCASICFYTIVSTGYRIKIPNACGCSVNWVSTSDCRRKKNIMPISNALSTVDALCGVCYNFCNEEETPEMGLIAQDVVKVEPRLVAISEPDESDIENGITDEVYGLKYDKFAGLFVEAIKELKEQNICLQNQINALREKNK